MLEASALTLLGRDDEARERWEAAREVLAREVEARPDDYRAHSGLGMVLAELGEREQAIAEGKRGVELYPVSLDAFQGPPFLVDLAIIYTRTGDFDEAFDLIERLFDVPAGMTPAMFRLNPVYDPLRDDPRYDELLEGR
jgi:serine/threonine-protein kinase